MRDIDYYALGASLYVPATHKNLEAILCENRYPFLRSIVICLEDAILESEVQEGMSRIKTLLKTYQQKDLFVFIRPRDKKRLKKLLKLEGIDQIDGFVLPKFDTSTMKKYAPFIETSDHHFMPTLESKEVFDQEKLKKIRDFLLPYKEKILSIRVGSEDILGILGMRREGKTLYEILPFYSTLSSIITLFKSERFAISSSVLNDFTNDALLEKEVKEDLFHNLINKTSIHPDQVQKIQQLYRVDQENHTIATKLLKEEEAIISQKSQMYEKSTHTLWADSILKRYRYYGCQEEMPTVTHHTLFFCDLDDTVIQTERKTDKTLPHSVAAYNKENLPGSYIYDHVKDLLEKAREEKLFIPTTARNFDSYKRTFFYDDPRITYSILNFGGTVLRNNQIDASWNNRMQKQFSALEVSLAKLIGEVEQFLETQKLSAVIKNIDGFYISIYNKEFKELEEVNSMFKDLLEIFVENYEEYYLYHNGASFALLPTFLNKRYGVEYIVNELNPTRTIGAGDSLFDHAFIEYCDIQSKPSSPLEFGEFLETIIQ